MWERKAVFSGKKSLAVALDVGAAALCVKVPVGNDVCVLSLEARCETRAKESVDGNHIRCTPYQAIVLDFLRVLSSCFVLVFYFCTFILLVYFTIQDNVMPIRWPFHFIVETI